MAASIGILFCVVMILIEVRGCANAALQAPWIAAYTSPALLFTYSRWVQR